MFRSAPTMVAPRGIRPPQSRMCSYAPESQHGFISGKSCITNLLEVLEFIGLELDAGGQIDVIYLDISKAFDKVNHERLTHKLRMAGFGGKLLQWFHSYLTNRNQHVTVLGATSNTLPVTSGVPQGSILGPLLFVLYVNDLPDAVTSSQVAMFADDTKLFTTVKREDDCKRLQSDLDNLQTWSLASGLPFNEKKCKSQRITRKIMPITNNYKLNTLNIQQTDSERDLGVGGEQTYVEQTSQRTIDQSKQVTWIHPKIISVYPQHRSPAHAVSGPCKTTPRVCNTNMGSTVC